MKVYVNGSRFLTQPVTGVQRYAFELLKTIDRICAKGTSETQGLQVILLTPRFVKGQDWFQAIEVQPTGRSSGHSWEQLELPRYVRDGMLFSPCNTGPLVVSNQIVVFHDASIKAYPESYTLAFRAWYGFLFRKLGASARTIITVSQFCKEELHKFFDIATRKIRVIYHGAEHILEHDAENDFLRAHNLLGEKYILAVGSLAPSKNLAGIAEALQHLRDLDYTGIFVGSANHPAAFRAVRGLRSDRVRHLGRVTDSQLRALYEHAACFVYPSFYEGFGLPPLEAMTCSCPVVASGTSCLQEICGDAVVYCDPHSSRDIADKIRMVLTSTGLQTRCRERGVLHAAKYRWEQCARETLSAIRASVPPSRGGH